MEQVAPLLEAARGELSYLSEVELMLQQLEGGSHLAALQEVQVRGAVLHCAVDVLGLVRVIASAVQLWGCPLGRLRRQSIKRRPAGPLKPSHAVRPPLTLSPPVRPHCWQVHEGSPRGCPGRQGGLQGAQGGAAQYRQRQHGRRRPGLPPLQQPLRLCGAGGAQQPAERHADHGHGQPGGCVDACQVRLGVWALRWLWGATKVAVGLFWGRADAGAHDRLSICMVSRPILIAATSQHQVSRCRGVPGAHLLMRVPAGQQPEAADLQYAADLAAWFSKARTDGKVE